MTALIILNGKKPSDELLKRAAQSKDIVICADGGAKWALNKIHVDVVIGDFDSVDDKIINKYKTAKTKIISAPKEKDETDGVLSVDYAIDNGYTNIEILCADGGRLDHQLGNIMLLKRILDASCDGNLLFEDGYCILANKSVQVPCKKGSTISVIPYCGNVVIEKSTGLYYPITSDTNFSYSYPIGMSNVAMSNMISLEIVSGYALVFVYDLDE